MTKEQRFGATLRDWRLLGRWTQREAAQRIGVSIGYLRELERGQRSIPPPAFLRAISQGYYIPLPMVLQAAGLEGDA